jgi:hypothetical protein
MIWTITTIFNFAKTGEIGYVICVMSMLVDELEFFGDLSAFSHKVFDFLNPGVAEFRG